MRRAAALAVGGLLLAAAGSAHEGAGPRGAVVSHRDEIAPRFTLTDQTGWPFAGGLLDITPGGAPPAGSRKNS